MDARPKRECCNGRRNNWPAILITSGLIVRLLAIANSFRSWKLLLNSMFREFPIRESIRRGSAMALSLYLHPLAAFCHKVLIALYENEPNSTAETVDFGDTRKKTWRPTSVG
jgi:hypothetical protein